MKERWPLELKKKCPRGDEEPPAPPDDPPDP